MPRIVLYDSRSEEQKKYFEMNPTLIKLWYYTSRLATQFVVHDILIDDDNEDNFYCGNTTFSYRLNRYGSLYVTIKEKRGFSFKNGKLSLWFGETVKTLLLQNYGFLSSVLKIRGCEWIVPYVSNNNMADVITKTTLEKVFSKKITNPEQLMKHIIRYNFRVSIPHNLVLKYYSDLVGFTKDTITDPFDSNEMTNKYLSDYQFKSALRFSTNPELTLRTIGRLAKLHDFEDILTQCRVLNKKYNPKWSNARFNSFHSECSTELMKYEIDSVPDIELKYKGRLKMKLLKEYKPELLTTSKRIFAEGYDMKHCIYTNYFERIKSGNYYVLSLNVDGVRATMGIRVSVNPLDDTTNVHFDQLRAKRNGYVTVSDSINQFVEENRQFFLDNYYKLSDGKLPYEYSF